MACLLQKQGHKVDTLVLLDGAPTYLAVHTVSHKNKIEQNADSAEANALCAFLMQYMDIDFMKVCMSFYYNSDHGT